MGAGTPSAAARMGSGAGRVAHVGEAAIGEAAIGEAAIGAAAGTEGTVAGIAPRRGVGGRWEVGFRLLRRTIEGTAAWEL